MASPEVKYHACTEPRPVLVRDVSQKPIYDVVHELLQHQAGRSLIDAKHSSFTENVEVIEVEERFRIVADYIVVVSGKSSKHLLVMSDALRLAVCDGLHYPHDASV